jgi:hypothetical protein
VRRCGGGRGAGRRAGHRGLERAHPQAHHRAGAAGEGEVGWGGGSVPTRITEPALHVRGGGGGGYDCHPCRYRAPAQVVVNPLLMRDSPVASTLWANLAALPANHIRFVPWLPYPRLGVAELEPPSGERGGGGRGGGQGRGAVVAFAVGKRYLCGWCCGGTGPLHRTGASVRMRVAAVPGPCIAPAHPFACVLRRPWAPCIAPAHPFACVVRRLAPCRTGASVRMRGATALHRTSTTGLTPPPPPSPLPVARVQRVRLPPVQRQHQHPEPVVRAQQHRRHHLGGRGGVRGVQRLLRRHRARQVPVAHRPGRRP